MGAAVALCFPSFPDQLMMEGDQWHLGCPQVNGLQLQRSN